MAAWRQGDHNIAGLSWESGHFCMFSCVPRGKGAGLRVMFPLLKPSLPPHPVPGLLLFAGQALSLPAGWGKDMGVSSWCL